MNQSPCYSATQAQQLANLELFTSFPSLHGLQYKEGSVLGCKGDWETAQSIALKVARDQVR